MHGNKGFLDRTTYRLIAGILLLSGSVLNAVAAEKIPVEKNATGKTEVEGFMRAGGSVSNSETKYMEQIDREGNYNDTHFGLSFAREIDHRWSATGVLFGSGAENDYAVTVDNAFINFRAYEEASFNLGKMPYPNLIVSDHYDEGVSYPWVRPPEEVYRVNVLGPALSYTSFSGVKFNYVKRIKTFEFLFGMYGGGATAGKDQMSNMTGAVMSVGDDVFKLRAAYNQSTLLLGTGTEREAALDNKIQYVKSAGLNFDAKYVIGMAEYVEGGVADVDEVNTQAFYYTLGIRLGKLLAHYTAAEFEADNKLAQKSIAYGLKYEASHFASIKLEYKLIEPTERVDSDPAHNPAGHFAEVPHEKEVSIFTLAVDVKF